MVVEIEEEGRKRRLKSRERGSQAKARGGRRDRVMGETEQRVQGKGRRGGQHCAYNGGFVQPEGGWDQGAVCVCVCASEHVHILFPLKSMR